MPAAMSEHVLIRRRLEPGDAEAIGELHERLYALEYGMNDAFCQGVRDSVAAARRRGWPDVGGAVWLIDGEHGLAGSLGLTDEGGGSGRVRWFVIESRLRGHGLGRAMVEELITEARGAGLARLELETFSALQAAAHIYRAAGFELVWSRDRYDWGPPIVYQRYELEL